MLQSQKSIIAIVIACISLVVTVLLWTNLMRIFLDINRNEDTFTENSKQFIFGELHNSAVENSNSEYMHDIFSDKYENIQASELEKWSIESSLQLSIPSLNINAPVLLPSIKYWDQQEWDLLEKQMQIGLLYGVVEYPHSGVPGEKNTLIIAGHSSPPDERAAESDFARIFEKLPLLMEGDEILISNDEKEFYYQVESSRIVSSSNTSILQQQDKKDMLTLITCFPIGTTKDRLVITAIKVDLRKL